MNDLFFIRDFIIYVNKQASACAIYRTRPQICACAGASACDRTRHIESPESKIN